MVSCRLLLDLPTFLPDQSGLLGGFHAEIRSSRILHLLDGQLGHYVGVRVRHGDHVLVARAILVSPPSPSTDIAFAPSFVRAARERARLMSR